MSRIFFVLFFFCLPNFLFPLPNNSEPFPSEYDSNLYEIHQVVFEGNNSFESKELLKYLFSQPTRKSFYHKVIYYYWINSKQNRATPPLIRKSLDSIIKVFTSEVNFFEATKVETDKQNLTMFYYQNGFHDAKIDYIFFADLRTRQNVLKFIINEGQRYKVDFIQIQGLDSIPFSVQNEIEKEKKLKIGDFFNELLLVQELENIRAILKENGYFYAEFLKPIVRLDTLRKVDSIFVRFYTGRQQRIGKITFSDTIDGQKRVGYNVKWNQLDFKPNDLFSRSKIHSSEINLSSLGTFELVRIDTSSNFYPFTDSTLNFNVILKYRKQQDFGIGLFTNRTAIEKAINVGLEASYSHRNVFGGAQSMNIFARGIAVDVSRAIVERKEFEYEYQFGINFHQPVIWIIGSSRIGLSSQINFNERKVFNKLVLTTLSLFFRFPSRLPRWTFYNSMNVDFYFERQVPRNYSQVASDFIKEAKTTADTIRILQAISVYNNLDEYIRNSKPILTTSLFGLNLTGDTRDNLLHPRKGYLTNLNIDGFLFFGISKFYRLSLSHFLFVPLGNLSSLGFKLRAGHIFWFDKDKSFVPFERQFFVGGANSVRGWPSRQLRFYKGVKVDTSRSEAVNSFLRDFVGNASIFESTIELRLRAGRVNYLGKPLADIAEFVTFEIFFDFGNAFQWLVLAPNGDYAVKYNLMDYIRGIAMATGFGFGYITPVGPLCIDFGWPVYDPNKEKQAFKNMVFHIRLGYAF